MRKQLCRRCSHDASEQGEDNHDQSRKLAGQSVDHAVVIDDDIVGPLFAGNEDLPAAEASTVEARAEHRKRQVEVERKS